jgi:DNA-binding GntR family transcriptional regulator
MSNIVVRNLSEQLVDLVRDRILAGAFPDDGAIKQDVLASELGISKIPLREALTRLEQEGLVRSQANRGYFVRPLEASEAEEVYALRIKLEPETVAAASLKATPEEQEAARTILAQLNALSHDDGVGMGAHNRAFHMALIRPSRQPITTRILERLHVIGDRYVRKHLEPLGRDHRANEEHAQLLDMWLARDAKAVAKLMQRHIRQTIQDLRAQLKNGG